jgi:hypothetical protein
MAIVTQFESLRGQRLRAMVRSLGETVNAGGEVNHWTKDNIMGDKSPKATNKHASQKQNKNNSVMQKKNQAIADKQSAGKKK